MLGEKESLSKALDKLKQDYAEKSFVMKCFSIVPFSFKRWSLEDKLHSNKSKLRLLIISRNSAGNYYFRFYNRKRPANYTLNP